MPRALSPKTGASSIVRQFYGRCRALAKVRLKDRDALGKAWDAFVRTATVALEFLRSPDGEPLSMADAVSIANVVGRALGKFQPDVNIFTGSVLAFRDMLPREEAAKILAGYGVALPERTVESLPETTAVPVLVPIETTEDRRDDA